MAAVCEICGQGAPSVRCNSCSAFICAACVGNAGGDAQCRRCSPASGADARPGAAERQQIIAWAKVLAIVGVVIALLAYVAAVFYEGF